MQTTSKAVESRIETELKQGLKVQNKLFRSFKAFMLLLVLTFTSAFASVAELGTKVEAEVSSLQATVITIGVAMIALAVIIGAIRLFKGMGKSI
jgi:uncharacterized BrkB/YihY/UPF0761 family membrane protein